MKRIDNQYQCSYENKILILMLIISPHLYFKGVIHLHNKCYVPLGIFL